MAVLTRPYLPSDRDAVDRLVRAAWIELAPMLRNWHGLAARLGALTEHAGHAEVLVVERDGALAGAVGYVGPGQPKPDFFAPEWPIVRMMSVAPQARGAGVGQALLDACIARAERDGAAVLALHTTPVMASAQRLYRRNGFNVLRQLPDMYGVPYVLMTRPVAAPR